MAQPRKSIAKWALSHRARNRLQHTLHGNPPQRRGEGRGGGGRAGRGGRGDRGGAQAPTSSVAHSRRFGLIRPGETVQIPLGARRRERFQEPAQLSEPQRDANAGPQTGAIHPVVGPPFAPAVHPPAERHVEMEVDEEAHTAAVTSMPDARDAETHVSDGDGHQLRQESVVEGQCSSMAVAGVASPRQSDAEMCLVCLEALDPSATGPSTVLGLVEHGCQDWCNTRLHISCMADMFRNTNAPTCPNQCRQRLRDPRDDSSFQAICLECGIDPAGAAAPALSTEHAGVNSYTRLTFSNQDVLPPGAPAHRAVLCCERIVPVGDGQFVGIGDRRMPWSPQALQEVWTTGPRQVDRQSRITGWVPQWSCTACQASVRPDELPEPGEQPGCLVCGAMATWCTVRATRQSAWVCFAGGCSWHGRVVQPPLPLQSQPATLAEASPGAQPALDPFRQPPLVDRRPPQAPLQSELNSGVYVPLLLQAGGALAGAATEEWGNHPVSSHWWSATVAALREAAPVDGAFLHAVIEQQTANAEFFGDPGVEGARRTADALAVALQDASRAELYPFAEALNIARDGAYIHGPVQESLFLAYLGESATREIEARVAAFRRPWAPASGQPGPATGRTNASPEDGHSADSTADNSAEEASHVEPNATEADVDQNARRQGDAELPSIQRGHASIRRALEALDGVDLAAEFRLRVPVLQGVPRFFHGCWRNALRLALEEVRAGAAEGQNSVRHRRAWTLFYLLSRMLLHKPLGAAGVSREILMRRFEQFQRGEWLALLRESRAQSNVRAGAREPTAQSRARRATQLVHQGEVSAARQALTASSLAPGSDDTFERLQERRPQQLHQPLSTEVTNHSGAPASLQAARLLSNLRGSRRGAAPGPSGHTAEHMKLLLDDEVLTDLFVEAATALARAEIPELIAAAVRLGRMTALRKDNGGVRGIVSGDVLRRLVARTLAQQHSKAFEAATSPFQYALATRAGTECVAHALRTLTELDPELTVISIDGVGAFDTISRQAMLDALRQVPTASEILPFVMMFHGQPSEYMWTDDRGATRTVIQAEGGEQGDALMPCLYALGQHEALQAAHAQLRPGEYLFAYLDDVYMVCRPERAREVYDIVRTSIANHAYVQVNQGKTKMFNRAGVRPPRCDDLFHSDRDPVWVGDQGLPTERQGLMVLGSPLGTAAYVRASLADKFAEHDQLLQALGHMEDLQAAWLILSMCAAARPNYLLRAVPPELTEAFSNQHDNAMASSLLRLLGFDEAGEDVDLARSLAQLPLRLGGLGLRSAARTAPAAHWASWADCLPMIQARHPGLAERLVGALDDEAGGQSASAISARACLTALQAEGFDLHPGWRELRAGARPPPPPNRDLGEADWSEWSHGWQFHAAAARERHARDVSLWPRLSRPQRAMLRSQTGPLCGAALAAVPTAPEYTIAPELFRVILLRRLRLPLPLSGRRCACRRFLDPQGDHRAACPTVGILGQRAAPQERMAARVCREAGARVQTNVLVRDLNLDEVRARSERRLEVVANGLSLYNGSQVAIDTTMVSPLGRDGRPRGRADRTDGLAIATAIRRKRATYPEFSSSRRCRLVVFACEVGGRWCPEAIKFIRALAAARASSAPEVIRSSVAAAWARRWTTMLQVAAQRAFAASLVGAPMSGTNNVAGNAPPLSDVWAEHHRVQPDVPSRMA